MCMLWPQVMCELTRLRGGLTFTFAFTFVLVNLILLRKVGNAHYAVTTETAGWKDEENQSMPGARAKIVPFPV